MLCRDTKEMNLEEEKLFVLLIHALRAFQYRLNVEVAHGRMCFEDSFTYNGKIRTNYNLLNICSYKSQLHYTESFVPSFILQKALIAALST